VVANLGRARVSWMSTAIVVVMGCAAMLASAPAVVNARPLPPGSGIDSFTDPLTGVSLADRPELAGDIIFQLDQPFAGKAFDGVLTTRVVRETKAGTLDFYYRVDPVLDSYSIKGFNSFTTDVDFRTDLDDPRHGTEGAARSADGDTINFDFVLGFLFVQTNAKSFDRHGTGVFPDNSGDSIATLSNIAVPAQSTPPSIPLPPAFLAGLSGLALAAGACHRFRRRCPR
jgi:hypothetical protein